LRNNDWAYRMLFGLVSCLAFGCSKPTNNLALPVLADHGPHGGHLFEMTGDSNLKLEFTLDADRRRIVIYSNFLDTEEACPLEASHLIGEVSSGQVSFDVKFTADPRPSDVTGQSSRFELSFNSIPQQMMEKNQFLVTVWFKANDEVISASLFHRNDHRHSYNHD
jgi:hypothetical protein